MNGKRGLVECAKRGILFIPPFDRLRVNGFEGQAFRRATLREPQGERGSMLIPNGEEEKSRAK
jgi:hypothetical protein